MASNVVLLLRHASRRISMGARCHESFSRGISTRQGLRVVTFERNVIEPYKPLAAAVWTRWMSKDARPRHELASSDSESDSDSDKEHRRGKERGDSEFWRLKMRTLHSVFDINKDGVVSFEDFQIMGDRFIKLGHMKKSHHDEFRKTLRSVWEEQWGPADDPYNMVTAHQYLENMHHILNDKNLKRKVHRFLPYLFKAVDKDGSGEISVEEFKLFFKCLGLKEEEAVASFRVIDVNHDNRLSEKEFVKFGRQFFMTEDEEKPSRMFWGPLVSEH